MKIAYYIHYSIMAKSGVFKKLLAQLNAWTLAGHEARFFVLTRYSEVALEFKAAQETACVAGYPHDGSIRSLAARIQPLKQLVCEIIKWKPDLVYTRLDMYYPQVMALARCIPMVLEVNSDEVVEFTMHSRVHWAYSRLTRGFTLRGCAGLVFVTKELAEKIQYTKYCRPHEIISNGIDFRGFVPLRPPDDGKTRLSFIGQSSYPWHGVDKIAGLAKACPDWEFEVIGSRQGDFPDFSLPNLHFHGILARPEYEKLLQQSQCALGTLALHRKNMEEACPLKTREYLAFGLPVVIGYRDTDFPNGAEFLLQIGNTEANVSSCTDSIRKFVQKWKGQRVDQARVAHLDYTVKEARRLAFFESIIRK